ncbi:aspartate kinase [Pseudooceanicola sp. CBS1P-1]|uniref:aspartate kinase n=1 Tax=Pseudooceanicola albus TaxID=2692189 RepID=A0A6L7G4M5_9RHOB|nr:MULTISPECIES: aspartate kinase [Pseudooceanicola]MBT9384776.1 aspartate kinase [Pseudooceanicola endophyticus]MXN18477.1 aspartate kinase [Pseudooceanicola albus]
MTFPAHTVEKIGGTSMSKVHELRDTLLIQGREGADLYGRIFVVSAFGGITNLLLEHKKSGQPGVYALFANDDNAHGWLDALSDVAAAMREAHGQVLDHPADIHAADEFVRERIEGARSCLFDLQRLCSYGHFRLADHMMDIRELLSGLGESHSAFVTVLMLQRAGVNARAVDLSGWRDENDLDLQGRIAAGFAQVDLATEMPIVTGYAQCTEGLMREFDRGYSEVTFARIAAQTGASEAIIHKEFHLSSADPNLVGADQVRKLGHTNYDVADQLSNLGMEAIHPQAAKILRKAGIPLRVANAFEPQDPGTLIDDTPATEAAVEIVTGLPVVAFEVFEQDMVGVKGYDQGILEVLTRHKVYIVSKCTNANTITHFLNAPLETIRRVERDVQQAFPNARLRINRHGLVSVIGRDLDGLCVAERGLLALREGGVKTHSVQYVPGSVDVQFLVAPSDQDAAIAGLHGAFVGQEASALKAA